MKKNTKGTFIAFEGIDGSGKSTQIDKLAIFLEQKKIKVHTTFEPTDGLIGALIRKMLKGEVETDQRTIASLFAADRTDHLVNKKNGISYKIEKGEFVLSDRYYFSSYAYHAQHIEMDWVIKANSINADILRPDLTVFIDVDPEICFKRLEKTRSRLELYEKIEILKNVRKLYFNAFERLKDVENIAIIDGNDTMENVQKKIQNTISNLIGL